MADFKEQLTQLINFQSMEAGSNTPDFILAKYLEDCLVAFDKATNRRQEWYAPDELTVDTATA